MADEDEYRELTAEDLDERWKPDPLAERPMVRTRYVGPDGVPLVLEHPHGAVPPPSIELHDIDLGTLRFDFDHHGLT